MNPIAVKNDRYRGMALDWVDTPIEMAKARGKARDAGNENESMWDMWARNGSAYQQQYHPELLADFVVTNSD